MAYHHPSLHAGRNGPFGNATHFLCTEFTGIVKVYVDVLFKALSKPKDDIELALHIAIETRRIQATHNTSTGP